jgi:hypothetical protein
MPEKTEELLQYPNTGLSLMAPKRTVPPTALRRALGVHDTNIGCIRSRAGETPVVALANAYSLGRLNTDRFVAVGEFLYRNGVALLSGMSGQYLSLQKSPPASGLPDYLFVTGGGLSRKILAAGTVENWGIAPPGQTLTAAVGGGVTSLSGRYWYHTTFMNTITGNRSNAEPLQAEVLAILLTDINLTGIPVSSDAQVDRREIWRTVGDGGSFFFDQNLAGNVVTTLTDSVVDQIPVGGSYLTSALQAIELPVDNTQPDQTYTDCVIDGMVAFWISGDSGKRGRLYYSPAGRPESVKGFVTITNDNDALQRVIAWNGRYVFTLKGVYKIEGSDPYTRRLITGVPGVPTINRRTVVASPYGIFYQAADGLRLFDGARSELVAFDRIGGIFRNETLDYFPPFEGVYADFARNQLYISNGTRTLAINYVSGFIRELGIGLTALFYEDDTKLLLGATPSNVVIVEDETAGPFPTFDVETGSVQLSLNQDNVVKYLRIKGSFQGQLITPSIIIDDVEMPLPPFVATTNTIEYAIGLPAVSVGCRLQATLSRPIRVEHIEADVYYSRDSAISKIYGTRELNTGR